MEEANSAMSKVDGEENNEDRKGDENEALYPINHCLDIKVNCTELVPW